MSNLSKALKMVREGKSLEFISKSLGVSMPLLEGMLRDQEINKKTVDKSFMPRSFVKEMLEINVLLTLYKGVMCSNENARKYSINANRS